MNPYLAALLAYAIGCVSFAGIAARLRGVDIRAFGSGNPGATNVGRVLGRPWGVAVLVLDVLKGLLPVLLLTGPSLLVDPGGRSVILAAAVLGHVYPVTSGFRGGKGVDVGVWKCGESYAYEVAMSGIHQIENVRKDLAAGWNHVVVVSLDSGLARKIRLEAHAALGREILEGKVDFVPLRDVWA